MKLVRYSTHHALSACRGDPTVEEVYASFTRMNIASANDEPLSVDMSMRFLPTMSIAAIATSPYRTERTSRQTVDGNDDFVLTLSTHSGICVRQPGHELEFGTWEAGLWRSDMAMSAVAPEGARLFNIAVPRKMIVSSVRDIDSALKEKVPATAPLKLLASYAEGLMAGPRLSPEMAVLAQSHMRDLIAAALGRKTVPGHESGGVRAARLAAIKRDIWDNMTDPAVSLDWLAARHGISRRYVRGLFYAEQSSFSDYEPAPLD